MVLLFLCNYLILFLKIRCENRSREVGICMIDITHLQQIKLCQFRDNQSYIKIITLLHRYHFLFLFIIILFI